MIYLLLLVTGCFLGWITKGIMQSIKDYRLALKVNSIQFSMKEFEKMQEENKRMKDDLQTATQRIQLLNATRQNNMRNGGFMNHDNSSGDGTPWLRENS